MKLKQHVLLSAFVLCSAFLIVLAHFANEARKEVYFLCGNFERGTSYESVVRQLNTADLSAYTFVYLDGGKRIEHSSLLHLHLLRCSIALNENNEVVSARYQSAASTISKRWNL